MRHYKEILLHAVVILHWRNAKGVLENIGILTTII